MVQTGDKNLDSLCPKCLDAELILLLTEPPYSLGLGETSGVTTEVAVNLLVPVSNRLDKQDLKLGTPQIKAKLPT